MGDGAMQLFVDVLQRMADAVRCGAERMLWRVTRLDAQTRAQPSLLAHAFLHVFVLMRALARGRRGELGFRNSGEMRAWLAGDAGVWSLVPGGRAARPARARRARQWAVRRHPWRWAGCGARPPAASPGLQI